MNLCVSARKRYSYEINLNFSGKRWRRNLLIFFFPESGGGSGQSRFVFSNLKILRGGIHITHFFFTPQARAIDLTWSILFLRINRLFPVYELCNGNFEPKKKNFVFGRNKKNYFDRLIFGLICRITQIR